MSVVSEQQVASSEEHVADGGYMPLHTVTASGTWPMVTYRYSEQRVTRGRWRLHTVTTSGTWPMVVAWTWAR